VQARFADIWRSNGWGSAETRSGPGSTLAQTTELRTRLADTLRQLGVRTLVDVGCGELNWMSQISGQLDLYLGLDIVEEIVAELRRKYAARKNHFFNTADITCDALPKGDAILCRDVLGHLSHPLVADALANFRKNGSRYLIATTFARGKNDPVRVGGWQAIDLCAAPFKLPPPQFVIAESSKSSGKSLAVWPLESLK
jgi:2-polyprenyl-3-methyl-5-hydroxy-6-metoxy-1,4-benzoquinol methylase